MKKKYSTIREIKKQLSNFSVRNREGNTLEEKLEIVNRIIFGPGQRYWLNCKKMIKTMDELRPWAWGEDWDKDCEQIRNVLLYLSGEIDKRPASLAVYRSAETVRDNIHKLKVAYKNLPRKLFRGINESNVEIVREAIDRGVDVNQIMNTTPYKHYPLEYASYCGNPEIVKMLLNAGADVGAVSENGHTALSSALDGRFSYDRIDNVDTIVKYLIDAGADVNQPENKRSPLDVYLVHGEARAKTIKRLVDAGADVNDNFVIEAAIRHAKFSNIGYTPEDYKDKVDIIKLLLDAGAKIENVQDSFFDVLGGNRFAMEFFVNELGADVNEPNKDGLLPLHYAVEEAESSGVASVEFLLNHGADINAQDKNGNTALMMAFNSDYLSKLMEYLLQQGADTKIRNKEGLTVIDIAKQKDHESLVYGGHFLGRLALLRKYYII